MGGFWWVGCVCEGWIWLGWLGCVRRVVMYWKGEEKLHHYIKFCNIKLISSWTVLSHQPDKDDWNWKQKLQVFKIKRKALLVFTIQRFSRAGPRGRAREWATLRVHPLSWSLRNNRLEEVCGTLTKGTFSSRLLLSNQDKGCTPSVAHSLPLPLPPGFCSTCQL